jgi:hypothetical protein
MPTKTGPGSFTFDTVTNALLTTTGGGGSATAVNITQIGGSAVGFTNALPVELSDGTNPLGTNSNPINTDNMQWGGVTLAGATASPPVGNEAAPVVRNIERRTWTLLTTTPLGANATYQSSWFDTQQTGDHFALATARGDQQGGGTGFLIQGTDDSSFSANFIHILSQFTGASGNAYLANQTAEVAANLSFRYWRVSFQNGATPQGSFQVMVTTSPEWNPFSVGAQGQSDGYSSQKSLNMHLDVGGSPIVGLLTVGMMSNVAVTDTMTNANGNISAKSGDAFGASVLGLQVVANMLYNGASWDRSRTPAVTHTGQILSGGSGQILIWQPTTAKKARFMRYSIQVPANATLGAAGSVAFGFAWGVSAGGASGLTQAPASMPNVQHVCWINNAALTAVGQLMDSGWCDCGNGFLSSFTNMALYGGMQTPQAVGAVSPTWTLASSTQWEAQTIGFKTSGNAGLFKLIQTNASQAVATTVTATQPTTAGNLVVLFVRSTNSATGIPAFSISSNTAGDTYTVGTVTTNASDGANGSSACFIYVLSSKGAAVNAITVSATNSPVNLGVAYLEYQSASVGLDAAIVGASGNSAAPLATYTTATAGDLVITAEANSANVGVSTTPIAANFMPRLTLNNANGSFAVADNWGANGLAAGMVNFSVVGTEE